MTIEERKQAILAKIAEIKQGGSDEEKQDMQNALNVLGVAVNEEREMDDSCGGSSRRYQDRAAHSL